MHGIVVRNAIAHAIPFRRCGSNSEMVPSGHKEKATGSQSERGCWLLASPLPILISRAHVVPLSDAGMGWGRRRHTAATLAGDKKQRKPLGSDRFM